MAISIGPSTHTSCEHALLPGSSRISTGGAPPGAPGTALASPYITLGRTGHPSSFAFAELNGSARIVSRRAHGSRLETLIGGTRRSECGSHAAAPSALRSSRVLACQAWI